MRFSHIIGSARGPRMCRKGYLPPCRATYSSGPPDMTTGRRDLYPPAYCRAVSVRAILVAAWPVVGVRTGTRPYATQDDGPGQD
jgi:hypothetical protein